MPSDAYAIAYAQARSDKKCGKSFIPDNAKCGVKKSRKKKRRKLSRTEKVLRAAEGLGVGFVLGGAGYKAVQIHKRNQSEKRGQQKRQQQQEDFRRREQEFAEEMRREAAARQSWTQRHEQEINDFRTQFQDALNKKNPRKPTSNTDHLDSAEYQLAYHLTRLDKCSCEHDDDGTVGASLRSFESKEKKPCGCKQCKAKKTCSCST